MTFRLFPALLVLACAAPCAAEDQEDSSPVDARMEQISRDLKKLSRQLGHEESKSTSVQLIEAMIKANNEAKNLTPESVGDRSGEEREKYLARYRQGMDRLAECLSSLKAAILADDTGKAEQLVEEAYALREKYHDELL